MGVVCQGNTVVKGICTNGSALRPIWRKHAEKETGVAARTTAQHQWRPIERVLADGLALFAEKCRIICRSTCSVLAVATASILLIESFLVMLVLFRCYFTHRFSWNPINPHTHFACTMCISIEFSMVLKPHFLHLTALLVLVNRVLRQWIQNAINDLVSFIFI